ncbi:MAG: hypothetical protein IJC40_02545 [Muribaculaceae bacterium]|nr:hypothetical protein [Muribaculaceae bacterium]
MNRLKTALMPIIMIVVMAVSFTSCEEDDPRYSPLCGTWELLEDEYGVVPASQRDYFTFYSDGTGEYEGYDVYGHWNRWFITWSSYGDERLYVYFDDRDYTTWEFDWYIDRYGYLYLRDINNPNRRLVYVSYY